MGQEVQLPYDFTSLDEFTVEYFSLVSVET